MPAAEPGARRGLVIDWGRLAPPPKPSAAAAAASQGATAAAAAKASQAWERARPGAASQAAAGSQAGAAPTDVASPPAGKPSQRRAALTPVRPNGAGCAAAGGADTEAGTDGGEGCGAAAAEAPDDAPLSQRDDEGAPDGEEEEEELPYLAEISYRNLQAMAKRNGLRATGVAADLRGRLTRYLTTQASMDGYLSQSQRNEGLPPSAAAAATPDPKSRAQWRTDGVRGLSPASQADGLPVFESPVVLAGRRERASPDGRKRELERLRSPTPRPG